MIRFEEVSVTYPNQTPALKKVSATIEAGECVAIVGLSGAGKSTLIRTVNGLVPVTSGEITVDGHAVSAMAKKAMRELRTNVGMIFQQHNLVSRSSVLRNVMAGRLGHASTLRSTLNLHAKSDIALAYGALKRLGMGEYVHTRADQLSGGQQQRVAIARALAQEPKILLADEPVASLDPPTVHQVMRDIRRINQEDKITTIINLHMVDVALMYADRLIGLKDGEVVFDGPVSEVTDDVLTGIYGRPVRPEDTLEGAARRAST
ncbi:phosphonate ABC transporter ATP-binding protein [Salisediminibacterium selenitireducens]|uniref:Phosphonate ABC transporter, ATPase subunit n=1 Tax=Bacillus selenitireducens (strain ATCC 700615 / DSM 15326 / MLS10) TaxID=439292 RepID=D6XXQ2_BACIE|nr:phosphonate ABC transporter ATP-binding protein [Salisediminibacterium selenitireducens]ADI00095.1 phosphonate ABC transporter, ATPase subunit [[Bacillus] selenitireducens MLS10]